ncbi:hypothetical protein [Hahella ganghwensis]|uniref:hypothetical protein n=1 Tax=Hahella ganghwensis TaxID=286420 RepID=UPI000368B2F9|nr:hypothetical protein [Hahella ganghwensis]
MDPEIYKMTMEVLSDAVKILGPAIITAVVGYKAGIRQMELKIDEINKGNEFKARDRIFEFHKEKLATCDKSIGSLNSALLEYAGMSLAVKGDELSLSSFVGRHLTLHIQGLPFQLEHINCELLAYKDRLPKECEKMKGYMQKCVELKTPLSSDEIQETIMELIEIYSFASHCIRMMIEFEALEIFSPYTRNA